MAVSNPSDPIQSFPSASALPLAALTPVTREDAQRAMNIAVGVCSPFWLPFVAATVGGASLWWMSNLGRRMMPQSADSFCASWETTDSAAPATDPEAHPPVPVPEMAGFGVSAHMAKEAVTVAEDAVQDVAELLVAEAEPAALVEAPIAAAPKAEAPKAEAPKVETASRPAARSTKSRKPA